MLDKEKLINTFYAQGARTFLKRYGMKLIPPEFSELGISFQSFCCSKEIDLDFFKKCIVVGGPCIKDCENLITIEAVYEIFNIIKVAKALNTEGVIFIGLYEEILQYGKKQCFDYLKKNIDHIVNSLSSFLEYKNITVIDTRDLSYNLLIKEFLDRKDNSLNIRKINTIFEFGNRKYKAHKKEWLDATKRVVIAHMASFINKYLKEETKKNILVIENIQQMKVVKLAEILDRSGNGPYQITHFSVPSVSGAERMYRAPYWDKIYLDDDFENLMLKQSLAPKEVFEFWMSMFVGLNSGISNQQLPELVSLLNNIIYGKQKKL